MQNKALVALATIVVAAVLMMPVLFVAALPVMLAFGVLHSHLPAVPALGYFETLAVLWGARVAAPVLGGSAKAPA